MSDYKNIVDKERKNMLEDAKALANLELNFRTYISQKGLNEESYILASNEYSEGINAFKVKLKEIENLLAKLPEDTDYTSQDDLDDLNKELGRIWRIIIANETFCNEYGGVHFTDSDTSNKYKEIYDKHLEELKEFMYYFIKIANTLFSK